jgi:hypothetical protein
LIDDFRERDTPNGVPFRLAVAYWRAREQRA